MTLIGTPNKGNFTLLAKDPNAGAQDAQTGTWVIPQDAAKFEAAYDNALESEYRYLIPGDYQTDKLSASFVVTLYQNVGGTLVDGNMTGGTNVPQRDYAHTNDKAHAISANLVQGHSYVITATLKATSDDPDNPGSIDPDNNLYPIEFRVVDVTNFNSPDETLGW